jgi:hypothetical protein
MCAGCRKLLSPEMTRWLAAQPGSYADLADLLPRGATA